MTTTTLELHTPVEGRTYTDADNGSRCQRYELGGLGLKSWFYGHTGNRETQASLHYIDRVTASDLYPERGEDTVVSVTLTSRSEAAEVIGYLTAEAARKLRDQLNELDL